MRLSLEQILFLLALVVWPIIQLIARARAAAREQAELSRAAAEETARVEFAPPELPIVAHVPRAPAPIARRPPQQQVATRSRWDRAQLRGAIVAMTVLGPPRGLEREDPP